MSAYLITGLPRSRTAWMAEFMGCEHEPITHLRSVDDINAYFKHGNACADHGLGFWAKHIVEDLRVPTLVIDRSMDEVEASLEGLGLNLPKTNFCSILKERLLEVRDNPLVMWVDFKNLNKLNVMQKCFWHLRPGVAFDEGKFFAMRDKVVEVSPEEIALLHKLPPNPLIVNEVVPLLRLV